MRRWGFAAVLAASLGGCAAQGVQATPADPNAAPRLVEEAAARRLYLAKCTLCHGAVEPSEHRRAEWPALVDHYGIRARLKAEDKARILAYLEDHAK